MTSFEGNHSAVKPSLRCGREIPIEWTISQIEGKIGDDGIEDTFVAKLHKYHEVINL